MSFHFTKQKKRVIRYIETSLKYLLTFTGNILNSSLTRVFFYEIKNNYSDLIYHVCNL